MGQVASLLPHAATQDAGIVLAMTSEFGMAEQPTFRAAIPFTSILCIPTLLFPLFRSRHLPEEASTQRTQPSHRRMFIATRSQNASNKAKNRGIFFV
jgi:hypothetical protein